MERKTEKKTTWDKLLDIPQWMLVISVFVLVIIPIIKPLGLPIPIATAARQFYETASEMPEGSFAIISLEVGGAGWDEIGPGALATFKMLLKNNIKFVVVSLSSDNVPLTMDAIEKANPEKYGAEYGEDYVYLGYLPGVEVAAKGLAEDIRGVTSTDYYGTTLDEIPIMVDVNSAEDFDMLFIVYSHATAMEKYVRQWIVPYGISSLWETPAGNEPPTVPYWTAGMCQGYLSGPTGSASLEILIGEPGKAAKMCDIKNLANLPVLFLIILGNIAYFGKKFTEGGK